MAGTSLFRADALDAQRSSLGAVRLITPISHQIWAITSLGFACCITAWLFLGHYTRREHVSGSLVPQAGLITVTARLAGTATRVLVIEGAVVRAGDPLVYISGERSSVTIGDTAADISAQLRRAQAQLQADLIDTEKLADQQAGDLRMQQKMLQHQIQQIDAQVVIEKGEADDVSSMLKRFEGIANQGYVSPLQVQQERSQLREAQAQVKALTRQRYEVEQQLGSLADQLAQLPLNTASKMDDLRRQLAQNNQSLAQNEADRETVLRAPADGTISTVLMKPGQAVAAGQSIVSIVPRGSPLQAQLLVPSSAVGFIHEGTEVAMHYQAFPYQKFGIQNGVVLSISRNALTPSEITALLGQQPPPEALYRVQVRLAKQTMDAYGRTQDLKPGMALDADLMLDRRRVIEWIFEPIYGITHR